MEQVMSNLFDVMFYVTGVPISIKLMGPIATSLWIEPAKTESHFGNTPIYGDNQILQ
jgi:hypothetical protein